MPVRIFSEGFVLPDGRKVRVLAYDDESVRIRLSDTPYVLEEAFLSGGRNDHAIVKLSRKQTAQDAAMDEFGPLDQFKVAVARHEEGLRSEKPPAGPGAQVWKNERRGMLMMLTAVQAMMRRIHESPDEDSRDDY